MNDISKKIKDWIQEDPNVNRKKLCKRLKDDNEFAYNFRCKHSEYKEFVKHFINDSKWAYRWGRDVGDREFMKHKITDSEWAYRWGRDVGDREFMKHKITEADDAFYWASYMGNQRFMKQIVDKSDKQKWIDKWNDEFEKDQICPT